MDAGASRGLTEGREPMFHIRPLAGIVIAALAVGALTAPVIIVRGAIAQSGQIATELTCTHQQSGPPWDVVDARLTAASSPLAGRRIDWSAQGGNRLEEE